MNAHRINGSTRSTTPHDLCRLVYELNILIIKVKGEGDNLGLLINNISVMFVSSDSPCVYKSNRQESMLKTFLYVISRIRM